MAEILPIRRKTLSNQSINQSFHRQLGQIIFSDKLSRTYFIDDFLNSAFTKLGPLKKLKFKFDRKQVSKLCFKIFNPMVKYTLIVWDSCSKQNAKKLEKVQLTATRTVKGIPIFVNREAL